MTVRKSLLKVYGYESIEDYFNYIVESDINGQSAQVKNLFKKLDPEQKREFIIYLRLNNIIFKLERLF